MKLAARVALATVLCTGVAPLACSSATKVECVVGADCASGACDSTGRCVAAPPSPDGGMSTNEGGRDSATMGDDGPAPYDAPPMDGGGCQANNDGMITRAEVPLMAGLHATYRIAENATVSTAGTMNGNGTRSWDLTAALPGDHSVI